jgi:hypothetical protein
MAIIKINMDNATYEKVQDAFAEIYDLSSDKKENLDMAIRQFVQDIYGSGYFKKKVPDIQTGAEDDLQDLKDEIQTDQEDIIVE